MTKRFNPDADLTKLVHTMMPFATLLGFEIIEGTPEKVVARVKWTADRCTANGFLHGGYIMAVADCAGNVCTALNLNTGARTSTIESKTNFFHLVNKGNLELISTPIHMGRTTIVVQTDIYNEQGKRVSRTTQTQNVMMSN